MRTPRLQMVGYNQFIITTEKTAQCAAGGYLQYDEAYICHQMCVTNDPMYSILTTVFSNNIQSSASSYTNYHNDCDTDWH